MGLVMLESKSKEYISHNKDHSRFVIVLISAVSVATLLFVCLSYVQYTKDNQRILKKEANNIQNIIFEVLDNYNRINIYIGKRIAERGAKDLKFILHLFREDNKINNVNLSLLSWAPFDWVDTKNLQIINDKIGIRRHPPDMSTRKYTLFSSKKPWQLIVSPPVFGNPSGAWVIPTGTGITDKKGKFLGTIAVGFNVHEFQSAIQRRLNNTDVSFVVLDQDFNIIFQSTDNRLTYNDNFYQRNRANIKFKERSGILENQILVGNIKYSSYYKMDKYPYVILTGFDKDFLAKGFINIVMPYILEFIIATIFFILYFFKVKIGYLLDNEKKLTSSLYLANFAKVNLIRAASHDLKNYIFGISGLTKLLLERKNIGDENLEIIKSINEQSDELGYFVEDLLDTNQNETGIFSLGRIEKCDIHKLIERMILLNKSLAIKHRIEIVADIGNNMPKLRCDVRRMKQILTNLITNAIKYSLSNTIVTIKARYLRDKKQIYIEIKDQGIGMSEEEITMALSGHGEKIDKSELNKDIDSRGIGMPIVKNLVELHNGKLEIESAKKKGSVIKLYFNVADEELKTKEQAENSEVNKRLATEGKYILLVDDNAVNIKIISVILQRAGCKIKHAENGADAISMLDKKNFNLILMDGEMPVMNGYEAAKKIRAGKCFKNFKNHKDIPIIAITGNSDHETIAKVQDCEMNGHLSKSSSAKEILDVVEEFLINSSNTL